VNLFQRLIGVWWSLWAAARGLGMTRAAPLPEPVIPPMPGAALIAQAEARGTADGRSAMVDPENGAPATEDQQRAIIEAYAAAENAYYAAVAQAHGDPAFTEAIQHRRGLRTPA
jgi:hypothetical protein